MLLTIRKRLVLQPLEGRGDGSLSACRSITRGPTSAKFELDRLGDDTIVVKAKVPTIVAATASFCINFLNQFLFGTPLRN